MKQKYLVSGIILIIIIAIPITILTLTLNKNAPQERNKVFDENRCSKFKSPEMKETCKAMVNKNLSICNDLSYFNSYCYEKVTEVYGNLSESFCEGLSKYEPRTDCYIKLAKIEKDPSYCKKAIGKYQMCSWELAKILKKPEPCYAIEVDCEKYQCLAKATGNISYCEKVPDHLEKRACFAKLKENVSMCGHYVPEKGEVTYIPTCLHSLAKDLNKKSICWSITTSQEIKWKCLADLGDSSEICNKAKSRFWKDYCLIEFLSNKMSGI